MVQEIGKAKEVSYKIGAGKTFPVSLETAWEYILSPAGINLWLGSLDNYHLERKEKYTSHEGITVKIRVLKHYFRLRMTWTTLDWTNESILQIRCTPSNQNTMISFHQDKLSGLQQCETMKRHWLNTLEKISSHLTTNL